MYSIIIYIYKYFHFTNLFLLLFIIQLQQV